MPNIRPSISFNEKGVCSAYHAYDKRENIDYEKRFKS